MAGGLKLYYDLMSQPSRAIYMFLKCNKIAFVDCAVALRKGEHFSDEFKEINPFQKVPCINDNGFKLTESVAILKYLATKYNVPEHWYPKDIQKQARIDEYMNWQHLNLRTYGSMYFRTRVITQPQNQKQLERWIEGLEKCLNELEQVFLAKSTFVNGFDDITIADLLCACELEQPLAAGYDFLPKRPIIKAYIERVSKRLSPHYEEGHTVIRKLKEKVLQGKL